MIESSEEDLYRGHHCLIRALTESHLRTLYSNRAVQAILSQYRPWMRGPSLDIDNVVWRHHWLGQLAPPAEFEVLIVHKSTQVPIGFICISSIDGANFKAELSIALFAKRRSRSALEALHWALQVMFGETPLQKLIFYVQPENVEAQRVLLSIGAGLEAVLVDEIVRTDGRRADLCRFALFRKQWETSEPRARLQRLVPLTH